VIIRREKRRCGQLVPSRYGDGRSSDCSLWRPGHGPAVRHQSHRLRGDLARQPAAVV